MTTATQVVKLNPSDIRTSGEVLARAFWDDPALVYILRDEATRMRRATWFLTSGAKYGNKFGEVYTTAGKIEGDAVWLPPGNIKMTVPRMAQTGMLLAPFKLGLGPFQRFLNVMNHVEHLHMRDLPERHWYLMILGVDPPRQGQGVGGALIQPILARADAEGLPCYLETMKPRNVTFYQKHGFQILVEDDLPKGGPHFWTMKRAPRG